MMMLLKNLARTAQLNIEGVPGSLGGTVVDRVVVAVSKAAAGADDVDPIDGAPDNHVVGNHVLI